MTESTDNRARDELTTNPHERVLNAEAAIRLVAAFALFVGVSFTLGGLLDSAPNEPPILVYGPGALVFGVGLWKYQNWARWLAAAVLLMTCSHPPTSRYAPLMFLCLYLLFSRKAQRVFEPEYAALMERESHLSPSIYNVVPWLILGIFLATAETLAWWIR